MRRFLPTLLLLVAVVLPSHASVRVEYRTSRIFGLYMFATSLAEAPGRPPALAEVFRGSRYDTPEARAQIDEFKGLQRALRHSVDLDGYPSSRPNSIRIEDLFIRRTLDARDLAELKRSGQGFLPPSDEARFFELLASFEPIYDALVWEPSEAKFEEYLARFQATVPDSMLNSLFDHAARFYGAQWPDDLPFTIAIYPIPARQGHTSAESAGSLETVAVLLDEKDLPGRFGVMFHEMSHSLYAAQPADFQRELESYFDEPSNPYAAVAYALINEALATALGNGWAFEVVTGRRDDGSWYADAAIDGFAKAIYPLVTDYLSRGQTIDRAFAKQAIELFRRTFPDAPWRFDTLFREIVILADGETIPSADLSDELRGRFRISSIYAYEPIDGAESMASFDGRRSPLIVGVGASRLDQLTALETKLPSLAARLAALRDERADVLLLGTEEGRTVVVMKLAGARSIPRAVEALRKMERIDPSGPVMVRLEGEDPPVEESR
jgi:hypothetical protein